MIFLEFIILCHNYRKMLEIAKSREGSNFDNVRSGRKRVKGGPRPGRSGQNWCSETTHFINQSGR
jgi:hypothetical protein